MMSHSRLHTNVLAKFVDAACILFYAHSPYWLLYCTMCHCNEHKLSAHQVRRPEQNTTLNAITKQCITA